ncbi:MAG: DNA polymerase IV [Actinobacteria bacterium]|nr:MAG: DNA polymerase IV [Actinomycetota bacterium]
MPRIAHLDMDAFYVSVELLRRPELRGKPVIVSGSSPRAVVTTATYEARAFGVHSAMPVSQARRLCPAAITVPPDFGAYRAASQRVWALVHEQIERVEQVGLDEGYLDLGDLVAPKAAMRRLVAEIRARTGLGASVGIGPNKLVAKIASDCEKPGGMVALTREQACERFASASPSLLPGIGPKTAERLASLGIATIAQLREYAAEGLAAVFGERQGRYLHHRGHFEDTGGVQTVRATKSQSSETTFDVDVGDRSELERTLERLSAGLCARLGARGLRGRTIGIKVRLDDWTTVTRARTLDDATCAEETVSAVARELLRAYAPPRPVRLLGVRVAGFVDPSPSGEARADGSGGTAHAGDDMQPQLRLAV